MTVSLLRLYRSWYTLPLVWRINYMSLHLHESPAWCRGSSFIANSNSRKSWKVRYAHGTLCKVTLSWTRFLGLTDASLCVRAVTFQRKRTPIPFSVDHVICMSDKIKWNDSERINLILYIVWPHDTRENSPSSWRSRFARIVVERLFEVYP